MPMRFHGMRFNNTMLSVLTLLAGVLFIQNISAQGFMIKDTLESFTIWFPEKPEKSVHLNETGFGEVEITRYQLNAIQQNDPNLLYIVTCTRYPYEILNADSTELAMELIESLLTNALNRDGGTVIYKDAISHRAYPGSVWRIDLPNNKHTVYSRSYAVNSKIFTLIVLTPRKSAGNDQAEKFLGSFTALQ
jgi:hypothetical protein